MGVFSTLLFPETKGRALGELSTENQDGFIVGVAGCVEVVFFFFFFFFFLIEKRSIQKRKSVELYYFLGMSSTTTFEGTVRKKKSGKEGG